MMFPQRPQTDASEHWNAGRRPKAAAARGDQKGEGHEEVHSVNAPSPLRAVAMGMLVTSGTVTKIARKICSGHMSQQHGTTVQHDSSVQCASQDMSCSAPVTT